MDLRLATEDEEVITALQRVQDFDANKLVRETDLGQKFALKEAVLPAQRVIELFKLIPSSQIHVFPTEQKSQIRDFANAFFNLLSECLNFDVGNPNPVEAKQELVRRLEAQFQPIFNTLHPLISFSATRAIDFSSLERDARAATQAAKDQSVELLAELGRQRDSGKTLLDEARALATEQGVSKEAVHFKNEADSHKEDAATWRKYTLLTAAGLGIYAIGSLFFHEVPGLKSDVPARMLQIGVSKVLIFGVIAYILFLCSRNFLSHKHNEIVNRHRQNALATFTALAEATSDAASSDIVLSHAAACIFSPQDTGYIKSEASRGESIPTLQLIPRIGNLGSAG